jgi:hypothetical protein
MRYSHCQPIRLCLVPPHPVKRAEPSFKHSTSKSAIAQQEHMQQPTASWSQLHVYFVCRKGPKIRFDGGVSRREVKVEPLFSRLIQITRIWFWEPIKSLGSDIQNDLKHSNIRTSIFLGLGSSCAYQIQKPTLLLTH